MGLIKKAFTKNAQEYSWTFHINFNTNRLDKTLKYLIIVSELIDMSSSLQNFQDEDESDDNDQCISTSPMDTIDKSTGALYLMGCTHSMTLSHHGVDELCLSSQTLVESVARAIGTLVQATLFDHSIISSSLHEDIGIACNPGNIFDGLHNKYNRESFYEEAFNYVVSQLS